MAMYGHASKRPLPAAAHAGEGIVCVWGAIVGLESLQGSGVQGRLSAGLQWQGVLTVLTGQPGYWSERPFAGRHPSGLTTRFWPAPSKKDVMFSRVICRMRSTASFVLKAVCGVTITFPMRSRMWSARIDSSLWDLR